MSLIAGRLFSQLAQVSGSFVGRKGLKIKALCGWQFRATYLFHFKGSTAFLGCFTELCFQYSVLLKCFCGLSAIFPNSHGGKILYLIFRQVRLKQKIKSIRWCWKYFHFGLNYHINPHMSCSNKFYLFSFKGNMCQEHYWSSVLIFFFLHLSLWKLSLSPIGKKWESKLPNKTVVRLKNIIFFGQHSSVWIVHFPSQPGQEEIMFIPRS